MQGHVWGNDPARKASGLEGVNPSLTGNIADLLPAQTQKTLEWAPLFLHRAYIENLRIIVVQLRRCQPSLRLVRQPELSPS
jgi:hypothetical protein